MKNKLRRKKRKIKQTGELELLIPFILSPNISLAFFF